jgi:hypothetical protein
LQVGVARQAFVRLGMPTMREEASETADAGAVAAAVIAPINEQLTRDLTAIVGSGRALRLIVVDRDEDEARREVRVGQEFRDGWVVKAIQAQSVILHRDGETLSVSLFGGEAGEDASGNR